MSTQSMHEVQEDMAHTQQTGTPDRFGLYEEFPRTRYSADSCFPADTMTGRLIRACSVNASNKATELALW